MSTEEQAGQSHSSLLYDLLVALGMPALTVILAWWRPWDATRTWLFVMLSMAATIVFHGYRITGLWRGCLIDGRNLCSLSRFQLILWTTVVLSGYLLGVMVNFDRGAVDPLAIAIPTQLWMLMGISTTSLLGSPLLLNQKRREPGNSKQDEAIREETAAARGPS